MKRISSKKVAFVATIGALGNALSWLSVYLATIIHPQIALDLSHIGTFIGALNLGPSYGFLIGCLVSITPYYRFGVTGLLGAIFGLFVIVEKGLTGFFSGILKKRTRPFVAVVLGYIPESIIMYFTLIHGTAIFVSPHVSEIFQSIILVIVIKAWIEIISMGFLMEIIQRNKGLQHFIKSLNVE